MDKIQFRRDTLANWASANPILAEGEIGYVLDDPNRYKMGDGIKTWDQLPFRGFDGTIVHDTGDSENAVMSQRATSKAIHGILYDVSAHNGGAAFDSLQDLLSSSNLSILIPTSVRHGGMSIRFVRSSDNKYVQYRLITNEFSIKVSDWENVNNPVLKSIGANLLDTNDVEVLLGYFLNSAGNPTESASYNVSGYIPVSEGNLYSSSIEGIAFRFVNFFDSSKNHIGNSQIESVATFNVPSGAAFVRLSLGLVAWSYAALFKSSEPMPFVQYSPIGEYYAKPLNKSVTDDALNSETVNTIGEKLSGLRVAKSLNLYDDVIVEGKYINSSGDIASASGWAITDYIPVQAGHNYYITAKTISRGSGLSWFDSSKTKISGGSYTIFDTILTAPTNAAYLVFNIAQNNVLSTEVMVVEGTTGKPYENYYIIPKESMRGLPKIMEDVSGLEIKKTVNLFDKDTMAIEGQYVNSSGNISNASGWATTDYISVQAGHNYIITASKIARAAGLSWFNSSKTKIDGGNYLIFDTVLTAPTNAAYLVFNIEASGVYSQNIMMVEGTTPELYETPSVISMDSVRNLNATLLELRKKGNLSVEANFSVSDSTFTISNGSDNISMRTRETGGHLRNPVLNFLSWNIKGKTMSNQDDIAPAHILNTTIGANHGQPCAKVNIPSHGFTNTIIGTEWLHSNGTKYYPILIVDANNIMFLSENTGTESSPSFVNMQAGTLTYSGNTYTVSTFSSEQMYPSVKDYSLTVKVDNDTIAENGKYIGKNCQFIESYGIVNPSTVLNNLIARAGQSSEPSFDGSVVAEVENIYMFDESLNVIVVSNFIAKANIALDNVMFAQAINIGTNGVTKYYIPNSLPFGSVDLRTPQAINWSTSIPAIYTDSEHTEDRNKPINRVIQYYNDLGFALGYVPIGVGESLFNYTSATFEVRNTSGKIYPHGVDGATVGTTMQAGDIYSAVLYRCFFDVPTETNRQSMYHFSLNGSKYIYIDYKGSIIDKIDLQDATLNGYKVEIIESQNTELKTSVYNNGFYVKADYVNNKTCYMVAKIN